MKTNVVSGPVCAVVVGLLALAGDARAAGPATDLPSPAAVYQPDGAIQTSAGSGCTVLPLSLVEQLTGIQFHDVNESKAMPAYDGAWGSSCEFSRMEPFPQGQDTRVDLMIFTESSASVAKDTFDKAAVYFTDPSKPKPSIGDEAYWSRTKPDEPTIHVLKG